MVHARAARQSPAARPGVALRLAAIVLLAAACGGARAGEVRDGLERSFDIPWEELWIRRHDSEWRNLLDGFSGAFSLDQPLTGDAGAGAGTQGTPGSAGATAQATVHYRPLGYWFAEVTAIEYFRSSRQQPWNGDFNYRFGFDDPTPYTLSLVYENYTGTRWAPHRDAGERRSNFSQGTWSLGYKLPIRGALHDFLVPNAGPLDCRLALRWTPRFDRLDGQRGDDKLAFATGCRYEPWPGWFVDGSAFAWASDGQQPWDPDFTYSFGYAGPALHGLSVVYQNYTGNRWPGHEDGDGSFGRGSLRLSWPWRL